MFLFQFSVTEHFSGAQGGFHQSLPGVFFFYDLSPIKVGSMLMPGNYTCLNFAA